METHEEYYDKVKIYDRFSFRDATWSEWSKYMIEKLWRKEIE